MLKSVVALCSYLSPRQVVLLGLAAAVVFEGITLLFRFGFQMQSTRETAVIGTFTLGLRVHHGYIGLFLVPLAWCFPTGWRHLLWIVSIGLIVSDLTHHFLVLWPITGSPQFDIIYPQHSFWKQD